MSENSEYESDYAAIKDRGERRQTTLFKNRKCGGESRHHPNEGPHLGNSTSITSLRRSSKRHISSLWTSRGERKHHQNVERYHVVDHVPQAQTSVNQQRKNQLSAIVPNDAKVTGKPGDTNTQRANFNGLPSANVDATRPVLRMAHLVDVHPNLFLGDLSFQQHWRAVEENKIDTMVWVTAETDASIDIGEAKAHGISTFVHLPWSNKCQLEFRAFCKHARDASNALDELLGASKIVLLVCNKAVNHSVSIAAAYSMVKHGWSFEEAISEIDAVKLKQDKTWNSLPHRRFRSLLLSFPGTISSVQKALAGFSLFY